MYEKAQMQMPCQYCSHPLAKQAIDGIRPDERIDTRQRESTQHGTIYRVASG